MNYYNEIDKHAAAWLRELIRANLIAEGDVDERSIADVSRSDIAGYTQCHFFAGIGGWPIALRQSGWPDDRQVWTGSCPCQPFSNAGQRKGFSDERHLWPEFYRLIKECCPNTIFGEQVASKDGLSWLDSVCADLERENYTVGAIDTCAAGFGAPHIRQRLYWVADSIGFGRRGGNLGCDASRKGAIQAKRLGYPSGMAYSECNGLETYSERKQIESPSDFSEYGRMADTTGEQKYKKQQRPTEIERERQAKCPCGCGMDCGMANSDIKRLQGRIGNTKCANECAPRENSLVDRPSPTNSFWRNPDWLWCRDNKWRPVESGTSPLANGIQNRAPLLRGYGNAIVVPQAQAFVESFMEVEKEKQ